MTIPLDLFSMKSNALYMIPTLRLGKPRHLPWAHWPKKSRKNWYHDWSVNLIYSCSMEGGLILFDRCLSLIHCDGTPSG